MVFSYRIFSKNNDFFLPLYDKYIQMKLASLIVFLATALTCSAQISRLGQDVEYTATLQGTAGTGDVAPFWFTNNRYGLGAIENNSGLLRANLHRNVEADSLRHWRFGYGADVVGAINHDNKFILQQLYADVQWKMLRLSVGQKERPLEFKNQELSSGALTSGINARPLPQIRLEMPDFWAIPRTGYWFAFKAHIAYGAFTDSKWQRKFTQGTSHIRSSKSLYHSKALFLRIGNTDKFPLTLSGGIEMSCQFGGEAWNLQDRDDHQGEFDPHQNMGHGLKQFWQALIPSGSDANDGNFKNVAGNQLGSWHTRLDYKGKNWGASFYMEHFFDDHSQMFLQYGWKDMLYGLEVQLPKNPVVGTILYEHVGTMDQSGPIYHDATSVLPVQISGTDDYYNHHIYGAWQHAGYIMGSPLLLSPIYNSDGKITMRHNRINAHHIGMTGNPISELGYRFIFTHERSLGTYGRPLNNPCKGNFFLAEATYTPSQLKGLSLALSYAQNGGDLLGKSKAAMLTIQYSGWIKK